jgi:hypothetical protein
MTKQIAGPDADHCDLRPHHVQQRGTRGRFAAVMADFQDPDGRVGRLRREPRFELRPGVAREPQLYLAESHA